MEHEIKQRDYEIEQRDLKINNYEEYLTEKNTVL